MINHRYRLDLKKKILGLHYILRMPNAKVQNPNECQNPNAQKKRFDSKAFGFDLTFPLMW